MVAAYEVKISAFRDAAQDATAQVSAAPASEAAPGMMESLVDTFMPSAGAEANHQAQTRQNDMAPGIEKSTWNPQAQLKTNEVATGVQQSSNAANAMGAEAEKGLNDIAAFEEDMKGQQAGAQAHDGSTNGMNIAGAGRGLAFEAGAVAAAGALGGPGAAAALGGAMLARDAFKAVVGGGGNDPRLSQGPSPKTVTLKGQEARDAERGHLPGELERMKSGPNNSFEAQAGIGYGRSNNPVLEAMSKGPGFGGAPQDLLGRMDNTMDFDDMDGLKMAGGPKADAMNEHIKEMKAGFENQLHSANDLKDGFAARANNGVEIQTAGELDGVNAEHAQMSASQKTAFVPGHFA